MPEYRGIVNPADVKATPVFDWGTVIQGVQKSLTDSEAARQASRDKLEKDTNDTLTAMSKITLGKDEALNTKLTDAAYNFKGVVGKNAQLVREGKMSQKDFNMFNQNISDTFNTIDAVGKNAKIAYDTYVVENKAGNLSAASDYMAQTLGLAASLTGKNIIADPKTGRGFIAGKDPNDLIEVNWLNNEKNLLIPKVQLDKELDAQVDKIAEFTRVGRVGAGGIWTIDDATARKDFDLFENNVANGLTSDPLRALSVLVDYGDIKGQRYTPTINAEEAKKDPSKIYIKLNASGNPEPVLTPEQDKAAKETGKIYLRERIKYEQKQVENTWRGWAPDRSGEPAPVVPTTQDIIYSAASLDPTTKKRTPKSVFTMDVPVIDKFSKVPQNLKAIYINPVTKELEIKIEEKNVKDGITTTSDVMYSGKSHKNKEGKMVPPDIAKISNVASQIYDPVRRRYLKGYKELYEYLEPQALTNWNTIQKSEGAQTGGNTFTSKGGITVEIQ
jgi:hypothetical protein